MGRLVSVSVYYSVGAYRAVEGIKQAPDGIRRHYCWYWGRSLPKGNSLAHSLPRKGLCILTASRKQQFRWHSWCLCNIRLHEKVDVVGWFWFWYGWVSALNISDFVFYTML